MKIFINKNIINYMTQTNYEIIEYKSKNKNIDLTYISNFLSQEYSNNLFELFEKNLIYNTEEESMIFIFGKYMKIPRKQVAYGEKGIFYKFSGNKVNARNWNDDDEICKNIKKIKDLIENYTKEKFNFVLINKYETETNYISPHKDDEKELGDNPLIVGISIGSERNIKFTHDDKNIKEIQFPLKNGSMYIMKDPTNKYWKHGIPKYPGKVKPKISLTFRKMHI